MWQLSYQQTNVNKIVSSCFSLEIKDEKDDINLTNVFPIKDDKGRELTPFKFVVKNTCDLFASYNISLEVDSTSSLESKYIKALINNEGIKVLTEYDDGNPTIEGYDESYILTTGTLGAGEESDEYSLRLWMDIDTPASETTMKKTFLSKIVVTGEPSSYSPVNKGITTLSDAMLANEYQTTVDIAKQKIADKGTPNFSETAPIIVWTKKEEGIGSVTASKPHPDINGLYGLTDQSKIESGEYQKVILGTGYTLEPTTGYYTLTSTQLVDPTTIDDYTSKDYYFCRVDTGINVQNGYVTTTNQYQGSPCVIIYKVSSVSKEADTGSEGQNDHRINYTINGTKMSQVELESDKSDKGLYKAEDDLGDTYYYRGSVKNNFVKLGDSYWRIIRRNGDGTVRIIYNGESAAQNYTAPIKQFNSNYNDPGYVGYMYGNTLGSSKEATQTNDKPSTMKTYLEEWYTAEIENKNLSSVVADEIFCNDRITDGSGFATNITTYYGSYNRLATAKTPDLKCSQQGDRFTQGASVGNIQSNEKNTKPIGLITADEVSMAGAVNGYFNRLFWLYTGQTYWTMSPSYFSATIMASHVWFLYTDGYFNYVNSVAAAYGVRPVINIKSTAEISGGIGTASDPFVIKIV